MSAEDYEEDGIKWQCGTDDLSKIMSEASVEQTCPHLKGFGFLLLFFFKVC